MTEQVLVHDQHIEIMTSVKVSDQVEIIIAVTEGTATLFFNDYELEFYFNTMTARIINSMIGSTFADQILYAQMLRNHKIKIN